MNRKAGVLAGAVITALLAGGCSTRTGSASASHLTPTATATPATTATATTTGITAAISNWAVTGGQSQLAAIRDDLAGITDDASHKDLSALATDGVSLRKDALTALAHPYPGDSLDYQLAMGYLATAGTDLLLGDITGANTAIDSASGYLSEVVAAMNAEGGAA